MSVTTVVYVGDESSSKNNVVLKCLTCPHQPLVIDTGYHEKIYHSRVTDV